MKRMCKPFITSYVKNIHLYNQIRQIQCLSKYQAFPDFPLTKVMISKRKYEAWLYIVLSLVVLTGCTTMCK